MERPAVRRHRSPVPVIPAGITGVQVAPCWIIAVVSVSVVTDASNFCNLTGFGATWRKAK